MSQLGAVVRTVAIGVLLSCPAAISGCKKESSGPEESEKPEKAGKSKYGWMIINYDTYGHTIQVEINGERFASFERPAGGCKIEASPLREGKNTIVADFLPRGERSISGGSLEILLSPKMIPGTDPLPGFKYEVGEKLFGQLRAELEMENGSPDMLRYIAREWVDKQRTRSAYEQRVDTDIFSRFWDNVWRKQWNENGRIFLEEHIQADKVISGKYYKPDGSLGAEIVNGEGFFRKWHDNGNSACEIAFFEGQRHGECSWYHEGSELAARGAFRRGKKHGVWISYLWDGTQLARSRFEDGKLVEGQDEFSGYD
ncbi:MAG: toxin-antitoxin system YwqK family antitoxin [Planctomycetota bacterium]|jgi:antitoxin component YwqK of YwqJK toxin-antitoxin module